MEGRKKRALVLVVDDDPDLCDLVAFALERNLYVRTMLAADGELALELTRKLKPDLVLLDIKLPKLSGLDVARRLKGDPRTRAIPLIAMTSTPLASTIVAGCDYHFAKPFDIFGLVAKLREYFEAETEPDVAA